ncbi:hypothetical protein C8J57DRAFT_1505131 [Mycena rebaudengoi]|nr:hypothetical protein C8J57DRAFT_1505131 [Mycena rebaudengoi]
MMSNTKLDAGSLIPKVIAGDHTGYSIPNIIASDKIEIQSIAPPSAPSAENLIVNTTVLQGEPSFVGWIWEDIPDGSTVFDGTEIWLFTTWVNPETGFCGISPGFGAAAVLNSNDLGTYKARWSVEFGKSTQSDAPVDPNSGCGPEPFDSTTVEFERFWEVVEAEY